MMAVDVALSNFSASLMGDSIEYLADGNAVGYGYAINVNGNDNAAVGSGGQARTAFDLPTRNFSSLVELEVSSVSKPITATAILHFLQSMPGAKLTELVRGVYDDVHIRLHAVAERSLLAHLHKLEDEKRVRNDADTWLALDA